MDVEGKHIVRAFLQSRSPLRSDEWNGCRRYYAGPVMLGIRGESPEWTLEDLEPVPGLMKCMDSDRVRVLFQ